MSGHAYRSTLLDEKFKQIEDDIYRDNAPTGDDLASLLSSELTRADLLKEHATKSEITKKVFNAYSGLCEYVDRNQHEFARLAPQINTLGDTFESEVTDERYHFRKFLK